MKTKFNIQYEAIKVIEKEAQSIGHLANLIDRNIADVVQLILKSKGRVIITGIGKSAIIAQKIVATLNSTGTPSIFMHAADAIHGDLGIIQKEDVVIGISKSGNSPEIKVLAPLIKSGGNTLVAITADPNSYLGENADFTLNSYVEDEACPNNLAPTTSTTAQMVLGDVLAVCLVKMKGFSSSDFAKYHPGGTLGKKLYLRVGEIASQNTKPQVGLLHSLKEVIVEITKNRLGVTAVVNEGEIIGVITDGDLRRMFEKEDDFLNKNAGDMMTKNPIVIDKNTLATDAKIKMEEKGITHLLVAEKGVYFGVVHIHDLIKEGII